MAQAEYDNTLQYEMSEEELVRELLQFKIYGEATNLDGIIEAAKKNLNETKARVQKLRTLSEGEQNIESLDQKDFCFSTATDVLVDSIEVNVDVETIPDSNESEEQLVQELVKFKIYGEETNLDGIIEAAKKNLNETKARFQKLRTLSAGEQNIDQIHSTPTDVLVSRIEVNMEDDGTTEDVSLRDLFAGDMNDTGYKDLHFTEIDKNNYCEMPGKITEPTKETSLDISLPTIKTVHHEETLGILVSDVGGEVESDKTDMAQAAEYDNALQCEESEEDLARELLQFKIYGEATTLDGIIEAAKKSLNETKARVQKLRTLSEGEQNIDQIHLGIVPRVSTATDVSVDAIEVNVEARHGEILSIPVSDGKINDTRKKDLDFTEIAENNSNEMPGTIKEPAKETSLDVSLPTIDGAHHEEMLSIPVSNPDFAEIEEDHSNEMPDTIKESSKEMLLDSLDVSLPIINGAHHGEMLSIPVSDPDLCPLPSSGHTCSERQSTDDVHSSGAEAISTQVSSATGSPPECEEPRSGCVSIESVMSSEQVGHLQSPTTINERSEDSVKDTSNVEVAQDGENIAALHSYPHYENNVEDDEIVVTDNSLLSKNKDEQGNDQCKTKKKNKEKKKTKVDKKEKRLKDEKVEKTKSKKFHRRLLSLFCFCFRSQEKGDENNETKQSTTEKSRHHVENTSQTSFVTIDLDN